jgi:hypothetical protein
MTRHSVDSDRDRIACAYRRFADHEAAGRSPLYAALAHGVAADPETLDYLLSLPRQKRQPNLLFAAVRHVCGTARDWPQFRLMLSAHRESVRACMLTRATQTNEPGRCATLLPVLAQLPQPLALIEVGASAGLCLLPDHYTYDYVGRPIGPIATSPSPLFACRATGPMPIPRQVPRITWRAGLDLNPLNVADPDQATWLETLVWPEQTDRLHNLRAAMKIAAVVQPRVVRGNLLCDDLEQLCQRAPKDATLVIFHTAVLAYVAQAADRQAFAARAMALCPYWIANEAQGVFPDIAARTGAGRAGQFLLSVNGSPIAWTDPHGAAIDWIAT